MIKKSLLTIVALAGVLLTTACGSQTSTEDNSLKEIQEAGKLVVAVSPDYAPFEFQTLIDGKNEVVGADIDLAQAIADHLGVELEISVMSFDNVLSSLQSDKADIAISGISYTEERAKTFDFSDSYYETENAMLVLASEADQYQTLEDFANKSVAVQKGTIEEGLVKAQLTESNVVSLTNMGEAINELKAGKVQAVNLEGPVAAGYLAQNSDLALSKVALEVSDGDAKAVAMPKGSNALKAEIDKVIAELLKNDSYSKFIDEASKLTVVE
ncbi:polar amino acid transport system substrate-binding protein [Streptococcus rupicaprae]|uniref:Polar amino acid transport system substrate-binding protein n=1 Tax=Streptococcus rupicaprae TaxID=759619 RepID=A0ABV2FLB1_9STRE